MNSYLVFERILQIKKNCLFVQPAGESDDKLIVWLMGHVAG